jgi:hypothetical protein
MPLVERPIYPINPGRCRISRSLGKISSSQTPLFLSLSEILNALCRSSFAVTLRLLVFLPHENSSVWRVYANGEAALSYGRTTATDFAAVLPE